ncbi:MAG TPA: amidohydrolase family protein [Acidimicrobiales bacterium]|nr:amidohydrolase family protein [Acidimicrobiales bacterium]
MAFNGPGFVDHHTHLLRVAAQVKPPYDFTSKESIGQYHRSLLAGGLNPMDAVGDVLDERLDAQLMAGLSRAAELGICQITEAGMHDWEYLDTLMRRRESDRLPCRVRILVASGLAAKGMRDRTGDTDVDVIGVKFYADGWIGPRTCALCAPFADVHPVDDGVLFWESLPLARVAQPFAEAGWSVATHAIGDRAAIAVLDAYEMIFDGDADAARANGARVEHAQVLSRGIIDRFADQGVTACIQPSFAVSDKDSAAAALGDERWKRSYDWAGLLKAGANVICGSDYPIEVLDPLIGLRDLTTPVTRGSALPVATAYDLMTDQSVGITTLNQDPRVVDAADIADLEVLGTHPA